MSKELIDRNRLIENLRKFAPEHYNALVNSLIMKEPIAYDVDEIERKKEYLLERYEKLEKLIFDDDSETYGSGYRNGNRCGQLSLIAYLLDIYDGKTEVEHG